MGDGGVLTVLQPLAEGVGRGLPEPGREVVVTWAAEACVLLAE